MSTSRNLAVSSPGIGTTFAVLDAKMSPVASGIENLSVSLPPSVYKIQARRGPERWEKLVVLDRDIKVEVPTLDVSESLSFLDPDLLNAVLNRTDGESDNKIPVHDRAEIIIVSQNASPPQDDAGNNTGRLTLRRLDGTLVMKLRPTNDGTQEKGVAIRRTCVSHGPYVLHFVSDSQASQVSVWAARGWRTVVFLLFECLEERNGRRLIDLSTSMCRADRSVSRAALERIEIARYALGRDEAAISPELVRSMARGKFEDPILGIMAGHGFLLSQESQTTTSQGTADTSPVVFDDSLFSEIVANTSKLVGPDNPDVVALSTRSTTTKAEVKPIGSAPAFWRSWRLLIRGSVLTPSLIPIELWQKMGPLLSLRPALAWRTIDWEKSRKAAHITDVFQAIRKAAGLSEERSALGALDGFAWPKDDPVKPDLFPSRLTQELGVPRNFVDNVLASRKKV